MATYRLPDGSTTTDPDGYCDSWKALAQPLVDALGWRLLGFGSGCQFVDRDDQTVTLTTGQTRAIGEALLESRRLLTLEAIASGQPSDPVRAARSALEPNPDYDAGQELECKWSPTPSAGRSRAVREALERIASGSVENARTRALAVLTSGPRVPGNAGAR